MGITTTVLRLLAYEPTAWRGGRSYLVDRSPASVIGRCRSPLVTTSLVAVCCVAVCCFALPVATTWAGGMSQQRERGGDPPPGDPSPRLAELIDTVARLRRPGGCPWDSECLFSG